MKTDLTHQSEMRPNPGTDPQKVPVTSRIYDAVLEDIRSGTLAPGAKLKVRDLTGRYDGSTGSCREVLNRLVGERFVESRGMTGFRVRPLSSSDFIEILDLRDQLERQALRNAIENGDNAWEERLIIGFHRMMRQRENITLPSRETFHRDFHMALIDSGANSWGQFYVRVLSLHCERYRRIVMPEKIFDKAYLDMVDAEHEALMELSLARKADEAIEALKSHRGRSRDDILGRVDELEFDVG